MRRSTNHWSSLTRIPTNNCHNWKLSLSSLIWQDQLTLSFCIVMIIIVWHCWRSNTNDNDSMIFLKKSGAQIDSPPLSSQRILLILKIVNISVIISFIIIITIVIIDNCVWSHWTLATVRKILFANVANLWSVGERS